MAVPDRPAKKAKLDFSDSESDAGVQVPQTNGFKINEEYAKRFEHNKKREERHRLEDKYGNGDSNKRKRDDDEPSDESSTDESEDDEAELATADVDDEIMATLNMIRNKDPRRLDQNAKFYREYDPDNDEVAKVREGKPMTLQDYQREKLLSGNAGVQDDEDDEPIQTYAQEQEQLQRELVQSMHAAAKGEDQDSNEEDGFMVKKKKSRHEDMPGVAKQKKTAKQITDQDVASADKDPETYLSNFMAARAWLPGDGARFQPLDSDDSDDDKRAEEFEEAYNMRFEDPAKSNEKLQSFARDSGKYGVRREEKSGRAKQREREREQKEAEKREREEEKARLRKLKVEEAEEKVKRIKEAAGLRGKELKLDEWRDIIEGDFDDEQWEAEMKRRFGEDYYAEDEGASGSDDEETGGKQRHIKKPKFDDDIDINDLIPDFDSGSKQGISLTDDEDEDGGAPVPPSDDEEAEATSDKKKKKTKKDRLQEKSDAKRAARKERMAIEEMVDASLPLQHPTLTSASSSKAPVTGFRYRETSPTSFGLSARDILFADDTALNSFAGLKKMAAFRDEEKKSRDKKKFSKKARLRQWRKETFGNADEPTGGFERVLGDAVDVDERPKKNKSEAGDDNVVDGKRKRKRNKKKAKVEDA